MERLKPIVALVAALLLLVVAAAPVVAQEQAGCGKCGGEGGECTMPDDEKCDRCKQQALQAAPPAAERERGWLGVELQPVSDAARAQLGLKEDEGLAIVRVVPDSPAQKAKLEAGDIIVRIGDGKVGGIDDLKNLMADKKVGDSVKIGIVRKKKSIEVQVVLGPMPTTTATAKVVAPEGKDGVKFEKPPVRKNAPVKRTPDQIREQARKFLDNAAKQTGEGKGTAPAIAEFMDQMLGDRKNEDDEEAEEDEGEGDDDEDEGEEADDEDEEGDEDAEANPLGGDLGEMLRGLMGGGEGEQGEGPDFGKLMEGVQKWMGSDEGKQTMDMLGQMLGGKQGEGEEGEEGAEPRREGLDLSKIMDFLGKMRGEGQEGEGEQAPGMDRLRDLFEGMMGQGEQEADEDEEGEEADEEAPARTDQPGRPGERFRGLIEQFETRLKNLEEQNQDFAKIREAVQPHLEQLAKRLQQSFQSQMEDQLTGRMEELGKEAAKRFQTVKKEMERLQGMNEKLMKRVEELEKQLKKSSRNVIHEEEMWVQPEGENQPMIVVKPVKRETKPKQTKPVQIEEPAAVEEERPWLGIVPTDPDEQMRSEMDMPAEGGVFIEEIVAESPAEAAGLEPGDFIVVFAGVKVKSADHLRTLVTEQNIGKKVKVEVVREGKRQTKSVKIGVVPRYSAAPFAPGRLSFVSAVPVPSNLSELLFGDRKQQGDDKKKKKQPAKQDKRKQNEPEKRGFELLSELESVLEGVRSFSGGEDLYIAIQDKRGNTFFRHKFEPEKILGTLQEFVGPLFERIGGNRGWGSEEGGPMEAMWEAEGPGMGKIHEMISEFVPPDVLKRIPMFHDAGEYEGPQGGPREGMREGCGCQCHGGGMQGGPRKGDQPRRIEMFIGGPGDGGEPCCEFGMGSGPGCCGRGEAKGHAGMMRVESGGQKGKCPLGFDQMFKGREKQGKSAGCQCGRQGQSTGCKCGEQGNPAGCKCGKQGAGRKPCCPMGGEQRPGARVEKRIIMRHPGETMPAKQGRMMIVSPPQEEGNAFYFEEPVEPPFAKGQKKIVRTFRGGEAFPGEVRVEVSAESDMGEPFEMPIDRMSPEGGCFEIELDGGPGFEFGAEARCPCRAGNNEGPRNMFFKKLVRPGEEGCEMEMFEGEGAPRIEFRIEQDEDNPPKTEYRKKTRKEARHRDSI